MLCLTGVLPAAHAQTDSMSQLIGNLQDKNPEVRRKAATDLGTLKDPRAVEPLITALEVTNNNVHFWSSDPVREAKTLGDVLQPQLIALKDSEAYVNALVNIGEPAIQPLIAALHDPNANAYARQSASDALARIGAPALNPLIAALNISDSSYLAENVPSQIASILGRIKDPRAVEPLIAVARTSQLLWDDQLRKNIIGALRNIGEPAVTSLIATLKDADSNLREFALQALVGIGGPAVEPLIAALTNSGNEPIAQSGRKSKKRKSQDIPADPVRQSAAKALGEIKDPRAIQPLAATLQDPNSDLRESAIEALGNIGPPAVEALIAALQGTDTGVQWQAERQLGEIADPRAVGPLIAALKSPGWNMPRDEETGHRSRNRRAPKDPYADVREGAALALGKILGKIKDPSATDPLIAALNDRSYAVRKAAASALGQIKDPSTVAPLTQSLKDPAASVRVAAINALGNVGAPAIVPLTTSLDDADPNVRLSAVEALGGIGQPAVEALIAALQNPDSKVRSNASEELGEIKDPRAVEPLIAVLKDPDANVRASAAGVLGRMGDPRAVEPLITALQDIDPTVRWRAAERLGEISSPRASEALLAALRVHDDQLIAAAMEFFVRRGDPGTEDALIEALNKAGDSGTAEILLNSSNSKLHNAAEDWASKNGYQVIPMAGKSATWGSSR